MAEGQLRIIGGEWRGRKLNFTAVEGLRPTPDRVRETVFNWLATVVPGATCLDLFAGSGAMGLEALSRGAKKIAFIELSPVAAKCLQENLSLLKSQSGQVRQVEAQQFLEASSEAFEIVFLDPPFRQGLLESCVDALSRRGLLAEDAWVYIETAVDEVLPVLPINWRLHREKTAGQVCYRLFRVDTTTLSDAV
jgi:16S rRNA (guanine966-N2)-methyltransferase